MANYLLNAFASDDPERFALLLGASDNTPDTLAVLEKIPASMGADVVGHLSAEMAERLLPHLSDERLAKWLKAANIDSGRRLLASISADRSSQVIELVDDRSRRRQLKRLVGYAPESIGTLVQVTMLTLPENTTYPEINTRIQARQGNADEPVVVLDDKGAVLGVLDLRAIIACQDSEATAGEFCIPLRHVFADAPIASLADPATWSRQTSLPVVDYEGKPVGYVTRAAVEAASIETGRGNYYLQAAGELITRFWQLLSYLLVFLLDRRQKP